jgi:hypothetical protein
MRKVNKILMATVSILLCLVLVSTSVVSGIFAKFAINNKGKATASLKAFGVTLDMDVDDEALEYAGAEVETAEDFYKVTKSVTITGLKMAPGVKLDKIINIELTGTPTVNCRFKLDIELDFDTEKFIIPNGECGVGVSKGFLYMPIYMMFGRTNNSGGYQTFYQNFSATDWDDEDWELALYGRLRMASIYFKDVGGYNEEEKKYENAHLYRDFEAGTPISLCAGSWKPVDNKPFFEPNTSITFNKFDLGFWWFSDDADSEADTYDEYDTYIMNHNPDGLGFTYKVTVSVEQIT